jgi:hypothetical protein
MVAFLILWQASILWLNGNLWMGVKHRMAIDLEKELIE